jgi:hypothetical protein
MSRFVDSEELTMWVARQLLSGTHRLIREIASALVARGRALKPRDAGSPRERKSVVVDPPMWVTRSCRNEAESGTVAQDIASKSRDRTHDVGRNCLRQEMPNAVHENPPWTRISHCLSGVWMCEESALRRSTCSRAQGDRIRQYRTSNYSRRSAANSGCPREVNSRACRAARLVSVIGFGDAGALA